MIIKSYYVSSLLAMLAVASIIGSEAGSARGESVPGTEAITVTESEGSSRLIDAKAAQTAIFQDLKTPEPNWAQHDDLRRLPDQLTPASPSFDDNLPSTASEPTVAELASPSRSSAAAGEDGNVNVSQLRAVVKRSQLVPDWSQSGDVRLPPEIQAQLAAEAAERQGNEAKAINPETITQLTPEDVIDDIDEAIDDTVDDAGDVIDDVDEAIDDTVDDAGDVIDDVDEAIDDTVDDTGDVIDDVDETIDEAVDEEDDDENEANDIDGETDPEATVEESPDATADETAEEEASEGETAEEEAPAEEPRVLVAEVLVTGPDPELIDLIYNSIVTQPGRTTTRSRLQEDVNAIYATGYFAGVKVFPEDTALGVRITFEVVQNPILNEVLIETVPTGEQETVLPPEVIDEIFSDRYGEILNLRDLQRDIQDLNTWYTENGYDLAQVIGSPQVSRDGTVTLIIAEGVIENIDVRYFDDENESVEGHTRPFIVTREVQLKPGDVFNRQIAQRDLQRVFGLGLFEDVKLSFSPGTDPRKVIVNVDVVESSTGSLAAGAGVSSQSGVFGTVSYQQQNLGGNDQDIGAEIQLGTRELLFDVSFTDPWIAGDPHRTSYTINGFRRRSISLVFDGDGTDVETEDGNDSPRVIRTGGGINFVRPLAKDVFSRPDWRLNAGFQYQRVEIRNADGDIAPISRIDQGAENLAFSDSGIDDLFFFRFGATQDFRNDPLRPTEGSILRLGLDQTVPIGSGSIALTRVRGSYSFYIPVKLINFDFTEGPQAFAFNVQSGTILGDLPPYEAFVIGGSNSVRGFAEGTVGSGRSYFQATAEYRFPVVSVVGGALFVDYGSTLGSGDGVPGDPSGVRDLPGSGVGYGVGIRVQSPLGPIRVDYGISGEGDTRIHFGIGERF